MRLPRLPDALRGRAPRAAAVLALAALLSGCSSGGDHRAGAIDLSSGGFKEIKVRMDKGDTLSWTWDTGGDPVHLDVHTHKDGGVQHLQEERAPSGSGDLKAPEDGSYYVFWQYDGNGTVELQYDVTTSGTVTGEYQ